jgi:hypothetical protein
LLILWLRREDEEACDEERRCGVTNIESAITTWLNVHATIRSVSGYLEASWGRQM